MRICNKPKHYFFIYSRDFELSSKTSESKCETVLILQGGGSLGAYECGVYKALDEHQIAFDMVVGTSIGAVNASIIAGVKNPEKRVEQLENFWYELSENTTPPYLPDGIRKYFSTLYSTFWGTPNFALPVTGWPNPWMLANVKPFLYDNTPLKSTLSKYVDFNFLNNQNKTRLIITAVDIQKGSPVIFDSKQQKIDVDHVISSTGFPFYGIKWTKKDGKYLWDGSLMSNTPFREAINASPIKDKIVYLVSLFPKMHDELPKNMEESWHRARDIMNSDKTEHNIVMSHVISRYLNLLKNMHSILSNAKLDPKLKTEFQDLEGEYCNLATRRGGVIQDITKIERNEESHFLLEDADFSKKTISKLINEGYKDAHKILKKN